ncbi:MAG: RNA polymerase sigma factor [Spirochaetaceae bacterium]|nr:MAG: RNA polymerase sigma factor [Spirochaetaceae bacterium]
MSRKKSTEQEFRHIYDDVFPVIVRIVYRVCGSAEVAEELCHEAFIRYIDNAHRIPDEQQARYWLIRVAKNLAFNHEKRKGREARAFRKVFQQSPTSHEDTGERRYLRQETVGRVTLALAQLPEKLREVLVMKEFGDLSYREIAEVLKITENNAKVRVHRAREKLALILEEENPHVE